MILDFFAEIIFDGTFEMANSKKLPMSLRIIFAVVLIALYLSVFGVLLWCGIISKSIPVILLVVIAFAVITVLLAKELKKNKKNNDSNN